MDKSKFIVVIALLLGCILTFQVLTRKGLFDKKDLFDKDERKAIEIGRYFLDGVGRETGKLLFIKHEEKKPNFYWDIVLKSDVEWDDYDVWDRMLKYDKPEIREIRSCWIIRFEQLDRPGHFYEVWLDASEYIVVGGGECKGTIYT
jgi:hypothetical protein